MSKKLPTPGRRRVQPVLLIAGVAASVVLSLSMTGTLSAFVASITNSVNSAASGTLILQEKGVDSLSAPTTCTSTDSGSLSNNASTCATINTYGGSTTMVPTNATGTTNLVTTTENFTNTGTATAATFTLTPGVCTQTPLNSGTPASSITSGSAANFCSKLKVVISVNETVLQTTTAAALATGGPITLPNIPTPSSAAAVVLKWTVSLDTSADNTYQGLTASQPMTWTLTS